MSAVNETLIRDVVAEVLGRLGHGSAGRLLASARRRLPAGASADRSRPTAGASHGAASTACSRMPTKPAPPRNAAFCNSSRKASPRARKIVEIVKTLAEANAARMGHRSNWRKPRSAGSTTRSRSSRSSSWCPASNGCIRMRRSGDHGITLEEYTPFGVVGAITPSTHSIPTLSGNIVNIVAAGNAVVFNAHPERRAMRGHWRCAHTTRRSSARPASKTSISIVEQPTLDSFKAMCAHEAVRLLCVTGGPGVVKAAMQTGKRAICAGPGNPPVLVDDTACLKRAAKAIIQGAAYDNNLLCIGEKEVFVLDNVADKLMAETGEARRRAAERRANWSA